jgi:hypothetical protein
MGKDERTFDIFRTLSDGSPLWIEAVQGVENVKQRLIQLQTIAPEKYRVYDSRANSFVDVFGKTA